MEKPQNVHVLSVRLAAEELKLVDSITEQMGTSRSEALRHIIRIGLPFAQAKRGMNVDRILMAIEILVTDVLWRVESEGPSAVQNLLNASSQSVDKYHA